MSEIPPSGDPASQSADGMPGNPPPPPVRSRMGVWIIIATVVVIALVYVSVRRRAMADAAMAASGANAMAGQYMTAGSVAGLAAPNFTLTRINGQPISLAHFKGRPVVLDFWATWCGPCKQEIPSWMALQKKYAAQGLQIIGIAEDNQAAPVKQYLTTHALNYPVAMDQGALAASWGMPFGLPTTFFINRQGQIAARVEGMEGPDELQYRIQQIL